MLIIGIFQKSVTCCMKTTNSKKFTINVLEFIYDTKIISTMGRESYDTNILSLLFIIIMIFYNGWGPSPYKKECCFYFDGLAYTGGRTKHLPSSKCELRQSQNEIILMTVSRIFHISISHINKNWESFIEIRDLTLFFRKSKIFQQPYKEIPLKSCFLHF